MGRKATLTPEERRLRQNARRLAVYHRLRKDPVWHFEFNKKLTAKRAQREHVKIDTLLKYGLADCTPAQMQVLAELFHPKGSSGSSTNEHCGRAIFAPSAKSSTCGLV